MSKSFAGLRIRERRKALKLSQSALADAAEISPSYLNLIEHNRRPVAGKVLLSLARALEIPPSMLGREAELGIVGSLRSAAADLPAYGAETHVTEEFVGRYPGWARLLGTLDRASREQRTTIAALSDRLTHDPVLQANMHEMLTSITAIRSTASILRDVGEIDKNQRTRFIGAIHDESQRLSVVATQLTTYFDNAATQTNPALPDQVLSEYLEAAGYDFEDSPVESDTPSGAPNTALTQWVAAWKQDADRIPLNRLKSEFSQGPVDLVKLAQLLEVPIATLLRRLMFQSDDDLPNLGGLQCNAAGQILRHRPAPDWPIMKDTALCPLWPIFQSITQPSTVLVRDAQMPTGPAFATISITEILPATDMEMPARAQSTMLIIPSSQRAKFSLPAVTRHPIGPSCRICPRDRCPARIAPQVLSDV